MNKTHFRLPSFKAMNGGTHQKAQTSVDVIKRNESKLEFSSGI